MKKFRVTETSSDNFIGEAFEVNTQISLNVKLPFTKVKYRCTMFDGHKIKLINENDYIYGIIW